MPVISSSDLDLDAPILPGKGAAGLRVGARITTLPAELLARFTIHRCVNSCVPNAVITTYRVDGVTLYVSDRVIDQIAVSTGYRGALNGPHGSISIGSTVAEVAARIGAVIEDDDDNLRIAGLSGLCFELEDAFEQYTPTDDPIPRPLPLKSIVVHRF